MLRDAVLTMREIDKLDVSSQSEHRDASARCHPWFLCATRPSSVTAASSGWSPESS